jgi:hypothetical protein
MATCTLITENLQHFPASCSTMIDLYQLAKQKPDVFKQALKRGTISPLVLRSTIRDLRRYGKPLEQLRDDERKAALKKAENQHGQNIHTGDLSLLYDLVEDKSVSLIFTDPPWADMRLYAELAKLAKAKLKPGGLCLAYAGSEYLPQVITAMSKELEWFWLFGLRTVGAVAPIWFKNLSNRYRPIPAFAKPPRPRLRNMTSDFIEADEDKRHHEWGHGPKEALYYIEKLTSPDDIVLDPFCGGGSGSSRLQDVGSNLHRYRDRPGHGCESERAYSGWLTHGDPWSILAPERLVYGRPGCGVADSPSTSS